MKKKYDLLTNNLAEIPCTILKGVGQHLAEKLAKLNIRTVQDLLFHLPRRYQDRTHITPIECLRAGDYAVIEGVVESVEIKNNKRKILYINLRDGTANIALCFFHFYKNQLEGISKGARWRCFGEVRKGIQGLQMVHPEYHQLSKEKAQPVEETLTPIYPATEGLQQKILKNLTSQALALLSQGYELFECLPEFLLKQLDMPTLVETLHILHRPNPEISASELEQGIHPAQRRLAFEELIAHHLSLRRLRWQSQAKSAPKMQKNAELLNKFIASLPFSLTQAQHRAMAEISSDLENNYPMMRLLQGDVGSGKTVVAAYAALKTVSSAYQVALMTPTEILTEQHYQNFINWLKPLGINVIWLAGKHKGKQRTTIINAIKSGEAQLILGTHALFQEDIVFRNLGFIIIDEQHRFGVDQRLALRDKGSQGDHLPHQLIMSATPIPRTMAMTFYADLDVSIIDELPPGRKKIKTVVSPTDKRIQIIERVRLACHEGRQVFWVCPLIEESEFLQCRAAEVAKSELTQALPELRVELIHGRVNALQKEQIMQAFKRGEIHILVATTVIEVGVDVPNASVLIVENAERLGLSQLHQLRGRVGRGAAESYCVLLYSTPLSDHAKARLKVLRETQDGFAIANYDMQLRGTGEILGIRQTGMRLFRFADLRRDQDFLPLIHSVADEILKNYPRHADLLISRWLPRGEEYGVV